MKHSRYQNNESDIADSVNQVEEALAEVTRIADSTLGPYRRSVLKRFPTLFALLVTFGVAAVFFGFERLIVHIPWLFERPLLILLFGVAILTLTGTLYKKLG